MFWGKVERGKQRGRALGYPTVNVRLHRRIPEGVYISETKVAGKVYQSVSFVGAAKTFGEKDVLGETYIFDFQKDLYGQWISVRLLKKIRGNKKFGSKEELIKYISKDVAEAREYFRAR